MMEQLAQRIRARRKELRLALEAVAERADTTKTSVARWEAGSAPGMRVDSLVNLAAALETTATFLLTGSDGAWQYTGENSVRDMLGVMLVEAHSAGVDGNHPGVVAMRAAQKWFGEGER